MVRDRFLATRNSRSAECAGRTATHTDGTPSGAVLFVKKTQDDVEQYRENERDQDRCRDREVQRSSLALDSDVTGQTPQGQAQSAGNVEPDADQDDNNPTPDEIAAQVLHTKSAPGQGQISRGCPGSWYASRK